MKAIYSYLFLSIVILAGCSHDKDVSPSQNAGQTFVPPVVAASQSGILQLSQTSITIKAGQTASVNVTLYNSDGTLPASQPSFTWTVENSSVATVSNGSITANNIGQTVLTVTDGAHGLQQLTVNVVDASSTVAAGAANITFSQPVLVLSLGQTQSFTYTLTDQQGTIVSGTPSLEVVEAGSGLSVSGNSITAGNNTGTYSVNAILSGDTLRGNLIVVIAKENSSATIAPEPNYYITATIAYRFRKKGLTSSPLLVNVYETGGYIGNTTYPFYQKHYQTSPDQLMIDKPNVVTMGSNGGLQSVSMGWAIVKARYKTSNTIGQVVQVDFDLAGTWCGNEQMQSYQDCYTYIFTPKSYEGNIHYEEADDVLNYNANINKMNGRGSSYSPYAPYQYYDVSCHLTDNLSSKICSSNIGGYAQSPEHYAINGGGSITVIGTLYNGGMVNAYWSCANGGVTPMSSGDLGYVNDNTIKLGSLKLTRGGNCTCGESNYSTLLLGKWDYYQEIDSDGSTYAWSNDCSTTKDYIEFLSNSWCNEYVYNDDCSVYMSINGGSATYTLSDSTLTIPVDWDNNGNVVYENTKIEQLDNSTLKLYLPEDGYSIVYKKH